MEKEETTKMKPPKENWPNLDDEMEKRIFNQTALSKKFEVEGEELEEMKRAMLEDRKKINLYHEMTKNGMDALIQTISDFSDFNYLQGKSGLKPITWEQYLDEYGIYED